MTLVVTIDGKYPITLQSSSIIPIRLLAKEVTANTEIATTQATTATTQAGIATTKAGEASTSASTATTQAGIATTQATEASASATAANADRLAVESLYDQYDDRYLGTKVADPTLDNDGNPLVAGATYWNSATDLLMFYTGVAWTSPDLSASQSATSASTSASTATTQAGIATTKAGEASTSASTATTKAGEASTSASTATTQAGIATTQAGIATTQATSAQLEAWIAEAWRLTCLSLANEAEDVPYNLVTSDGDGTFTYTAQTGLYSAKHWELKCLAIQASLPDNATIVHTTGNETVGGIKTFSSEIVGNISGSAGSAGSASALTGAQADAIVANSAKVSNVSTNLGYTASTTNGVVTSSDGTNATIPLVVASGNAGLQTGADKTKLNGIATGANAYVLPNSASTVSGGLKSRINGSVLYLTNNGGTA